MHGFLETSAAGGRRIGTPLPRVYTDGISADQFVEYSATINPSATALRVTIDDIARDTIAGEAIRPRNANSYRYTKIAESTQQAVNSRNRDKEIKTSIPDDSHVRKLNLGALEHIHQKYDYADKSPNSDIAHGLGISETRPQQAI